MVSSSCKKVLSLAIFWVRFHGIVLIYWIKKEIWKKPFCPKWIRTLKIIGNSGFWGWTTKDPSLHRAKDIEFSASRFYEQCLSSLSSSRRKYSLPCLRFSVWVLSIHVFALNFIITRRVFLNHWEVLHVLIKFLKLCFVALSYQSNVNRKSSRAPYE